MDDLDELIRAQSLYAPMDKNYEMAIEDKPIVKALCINIAHDCNLRCKYCFAGQGGYGQWRMLMSFDVARGLLISSSPTADTVNIASWTFSAVNRS